MAAGAEDGGRRIGALWVPDLVLRAHLDAAALAGPAAVVDGAGAGGGRVRVATAAALVAGVVPGQDRVQAQARLPELVVAGLAPTRLAAAQARLLRAATTLSPVVEDGRAVAGADNPLAGAGLVRFDAAGLGLLHDGPEALLDAAVAAAADAGLPGALGAIAGGPGVAGLLAVNGGARVVRPGRDRGALAALPLAALALPEAPGLSTEALRHLWLLSVRTLGGFAALPAASVEARFGTPGLALHRLARGVDPRPLVPVAEAEALVLRGEAPHPARTVDRAVAVVRPLLDALAGRLHRAGLGLTRLELAWGLRGGTARRALEILDPLADGGALAALVRLDLEARPLQGAVVDVAVRAGRTVARDTGQGELFGRPSGGLGKAVARLGGRLGAAGLGVPVLDDRHRPEARAHLAAVGAGAGRRAEPGPAPAPGAAPLAMRLLPVPRPVRVELGAEGRPIRVDGQPARSAGPFPQSGEWWAAGYDRAYFEVETAAGLWWLYRDGADGRWFVHGVFD